MFYSNRVTTYSSIGGDECVIILLEKYWGGMHPPGMYAFGSTRTKSPTARHRCDVSVLPNRYAAEVVSCARFAFWRNRPTASIMKICTVLTLQNIAVIA